MIENFNWAQLGMGVLAGVLLGSLVVLWYTKDKPDRKPLIFRQRNADGSLDTTTTMKVVAIVLTVFLMIFLGIGATVSAIFQLTSENHLGLDPTKGWLDILDSVLLFLAAMLGISVGGTWAKRSTARADIIEATARAQTGISASPPSKPGVNVPLGAPRPSGSVPQALLEEFDNHQPGKYDDERD